MPLIEELKIHVYMIYLFKTSLLTLLIGIAMSSCNSTHGVTKEMLFTECSIHLMSDSVHSSFVLSDSIVTDLCCPKKVVCKLESVNPADTHRADTVANLAKELYPVLDFLFLNPSNFESDEIVFGYFSPSVTYKYYGKGGRHLSLQFDFGLKKWQIINTEKNIIKKGDLKENTSELLRFTRLLFPKDITLQIMSENIKSIQK